MMRRIVKSWVTQVAGSAVPLAAWPTYCAPDRGLIAAPRRAALVPADARGLTVISRLTGSAWSPSG